MDRPDEVRKRRQRAAYAEYTRLQWRLYGLPYDDPARAGLQEAVRAADRRWRSLMDTPVVVPTGRFAIIGDQRAVRARFTHADALWSESPSP